jgi:hypothetical protein
MTGTPDRDIVEVQIGRPLRAESSVVSRCHLELPVVIKVPPILEDGTPFPTLYWLTCPLARTRIGRLESSGGVRRMENKARSDPEFARSLEEAHRSYAAERDALIGDVAGPFPTGGVGGTAHGVKCLHAHYAHERAGGANPVGAMVENWIGPLDCVVPCVKGTGMNPDWVNRP